MDNGKGRDTNSNAPWPPQNPPSDYAQDIPDITKQFNQDMANAEKNYSIVRMLPVPVRMIIFYQLVKPGAKYDLKVSDDFTYGPPKEWFIYNGEYIYRDVPGNIMYGYLGKVFGFSDSTLFAAGGAVQVLVDKEANPDWGNTWYDDPRDHAAIEQGIEYYFQTHEQSLPSLWDLIKSPVWI